MMKTNVGGIDKTLRIVVGAALLAMLAWGDGNLRWLGLIGLVPLATALIGWCPLYTLLGVNTCPAGGKRSA
jgi:hypothetical protein